MTRPPSATRVSVVMSVYNGARYLRRAIESVLAQTYADFEFVIVNDGSKDESGEIIRSYRDARIRCVEQANAGLPAALNRGIGLARGAYVARMDADDVSLPTRFAHEVEFLDEHPEYAMVGASCRVIDEAENQKFVMRHPSEDVHIRWLLLFDCPFVHSTVMFRRQAVEAVGLYRAERGYCVEDYDLWSRVLMRYKGHNLTEPLLLYRDNPAGISHSKRSTQEEQCVEVSARNISSLLGDEFSVERAYRLRCLRAGRLGRLSSHDLQQSLEDFSRVQQAFSAQRSAELKLDRATRAQVIRESARIRLLAGCLLARRRRLREASCLWRSAFRDDPLVLLDAETLKSLFLPMARLCVHSFRRALPLKRTLALPRLRGPRQTCRRVVTCYTDFVARFSAHRTSADRKSGLDVLSEAGIALEVSRPFWRGVHVYLNDEGVNRFSRGKRILIRAEPPNVLPRLYDDGYVRQFQCIVSIVKAGADFHWCYPTHHHVNLNRPLAERRLLSFMNANKRARGFLQNDLYSERVRAVSEILDASQGAVPDVYGLGWSGMATDKGYVTDKLETLSRYLFNLCFENYRAEGYVTEKIIDCFYAGTIPVYLGAPDITQYVPGEAFIDACEFPSYVDLLAFLTELSGRPVELNRYLEEGKRFLASQTFEDRFTSFAFATQIVNAITHVAKDG